MSLVACGFKWITQETKSDSPNFIAEPLEHECTVVIMPDKPHHTHICKCWVSKKVETNVSEGQASYPGTPAKPPSSL